MEKSKNQSSQKFQAQIKDQKIELNYTGSEQPLNSAESLLWGDNDSSSSQQSNLDLLRDHNPVEHE